jgi:hypothetical protein
LELSSRFIASGIGSLEILSEDGGLILDRGWIDTREGRRSRVLAVLPALMQLTPADLDRLAHEYFFADEPDRTSAIQPLELVQARGERVVRLGTPELVLVSDYSGFGKSSVVCE